MEQGERFHEEERKITEALLFDVELETGVEIRVPLFINEGEMIEVDTRDGSYVNRAK